MATYYVELNGGELSPKTTLKGGGLVPSVSFTGAVIYPTSGGGGGANLETKSVSYTPSETAISDTLLPDPGYDGFDEVDVSVGAIPSNYVGSAIPLKSSSDLTVSGATVTAPSGYYSSNATKTIPNASPIILSGVAVQNDGTVEVDLDIVNGGYIPSQSDTLEAGTFSVQSAQTITPTTTNQTIASGRYLTGNQTILGDADLVAGNIKKDVEIFGVVGTYEGGGGGGSAITVTDTIDPVSGGTIREITGVDISNDTVTADKLAYGYTAHMADGTAITGTRRFWVEITIPTDGAVTQALDPYTLYHFTGNLTSLTITLNPTSDIAHYHFDFLSGSTAPTLTMPNTVTMPDSFSVEASKRYEVDVLNNYGSVIAWTE